MKGFTPYPTDFADRYRAAGYWKDKTIAQTFQKVCLDNPKRIAIASDTREVSYGELDTISTRVGLNLLDRGLKPGDIVVLQLGNVLEFVYLYFGLQKMGARPILALHTHRYTELKQFVELSGAVAIFTADKAKDVDFREVANQIQRETATLKLKFVLGETREDFISIGDLIANTSSRQASQLVAIQDEIDTCQPALFLLSGGTTAIPKLIPRTHNDYVYNSEMAASVTGVGPDKVLLLVLPIAHNLPLACPGLQGFMLHGATCIIHNSTRPEHVFPLIEKHRVTHIHVVPALLITWMNSPILKDFDLTSAEVIQSGGQRLQPETRLLTQASLKNCRVQENFGMAEGLLMFVRLDDPPNVRLETVGRPICQDDEILLLGEDDKPVTYGEVGEFCARGPYTLRGYFNAEEHNARAFTPDGFYRSGDLMRQHASGNYIVEGRKKDVINRGGEKISAEEVENLILAHPSVKNAACVSMYDAVMGEKMCACVLLKDGAHLSFDALFAHLILQDIAKYKLPERLEIFDDFPLSTFEKVSKNDLVAEVKRRIEM
jgi:2,3-dihydroxybenzoate-AMP ligase